MKSVASLNLENQSVVSGAKIAKKIHERIKPRERGMKGHAKLWNISEL